MPSSTQGHSNPNIFGVEASTIWNSSTSPNVRRHPQGMRRPARHVYEAMVHPCAQLPPRLRGPGTMSNYFPIVVHATTDTVVLVTDAKFVASPTRRHADDLRRVQQQMEREKEKMGSPPTSS